MVFKERTFMPHLFRRSSERKKVKDVDKDNVREGNLLEKLEKSIKDRNLDDIKESIDMLEPLLKDHEEKLAKLMEFQNVEIQDLIDHLVTLSRKLRQLKSMGLKDDEDIKKEEAKILSHMAFIHKALKHRRVMSQHYLQMMDDVA